MLTISASSPDVLGAILRDAQVPRCPDHARGRDWLRGTSAMYAEAIQVDLQSERVRDGMIRISAGMFWMVRIGTITKRNRPAASVSMDFSLTRLLPPILSLPNSWPEPARLPDPCPIQKTIPAYCRRCCMQARRLFANRLGVSIFRTGHNGGRFSKVPTGVISMVRLAALKDEMEQEIP